MKKYLLVSAIILPIGGFFILFQYFSSSRAIKTVRAVNEEIPAIENAQAKTNETIEAQTAPEINIEEIAISSPEKKINDTSVGKEMNADTAATKCTYPSQIIDTTAWKQTLPIGSSGKPTEIKYASLSSYSSDPYFKTNSSCDGVIFRAPVNGVTTSGSGYPRSELREMSADGKNMASWSTTSGTHSMFIDQAITAIPKVKKHVVAGQIHDSEDDVIVIRLEYPKLFVDINGKEGPTLDPNYTLGKRFTVKFEASGGQIKVFYNGNTSPAYSMKKATSGNYFKAGAYTQSNCSKEKDCSANNFGEVVIYKLSVQH